MDNGEKLRHAIYFSAKITADIVHNFTIVGNFKGIFRIFSVKTK